MPRRLTGIRNEAFYYRACVLTPGTNQNTTPRLPYFNVTVKHADRLLLLGQGIANIMLKHNFRVGSPIESVSEMVYVPGASIKRRYLQSR